VGRVVSLGIAAAFQLSRDREQEVEHANLYLLPGL
jgi:hypothetical protein